MFIDQDNYMLNRMTKSAGAKIVVHDPSMAPMPDEHGIDLQPNTGSSIAVHAVSFRHFTKKKFIYRPLGAQTHWSSTSGVHAFL